MRSLKTYLAFGLIGLLLVTLVGSAPLASAQDDDGDSGVSGLIELFLPFTGGDVTVAGYLVGIFFFIAPLTVIGLAVAAASKSGQYGGLLILCFFLLGMFICVVTGLFPWWFLIFIIAVLSLIFARGWLTGKD